MFFPVTDVDVNPLIPLVVAFIISFFTSMGGISGAFLLLPFQVSILGFDSPAVSATNHVFNIVAIPSGVYRYAKEGRMLWPLARIIIIGTLPGVFVGAILRIEYLPDPKNFKMFAALVLLYIGARLLKDILEGKAPKERTFSEEKSPGDGSERTRSAKILLKEVGLARIVYDFDGRDYRVNTVGVMGLSLVVGVVGGIYGIGGGAIMAPFLVSFFRLPVHTVAGATLTATFAASVAGVLFYQAIAPFRPDMAVAPDYDLGLLFGAGGFAGVYLGARLQKFVPARIIKWILASCILFTALEYIADFVK